MNDDWRLTEAQVSTACEMHTKLENWRFADRAFEFLKGRQFESEEVCLLMVVACCGCSLQHEPSIQSRSTRRDCEIHLPDSGEALGTSGGYPESGGGHSSAGVHDRKH